MPLTRPGLPSRALTAARPAEPQELRRETMAISGVQLALERLPLPELGMPAARRREPNGRTLAPPAKVDCHDSQALRASEIVAHPSRWPTTDVSEAAVRAGHAGSDGVNGTTTTPRMPSARAFATNCGKIPREGKKQKTHGA